MRARKPRDAGYTLVELAVVMFLVGLILSVTLPKLVPVIAFSELQGSARRLANYGRGVVAEAALERGTITVYFDLDAQEYYSVRLVYPEGEAGFEGETDQWGLLSDSGAFNSPDFMDNLRASRDGGKGMLDGMDGFDDGAANAQLASRFDKMAWRITEERARNVIPDESFLDEIGPLFEEEFTLEETEPEEVELTDVILERTRLPETISIEAVVIEGMEYSSGLIDVEVSPLGLLDLVGIYLVNDNEEYYTVSWDPVTGYAKFESGRKDLFAEWDGIDTASGWE